MMCSYARQPVERLFERTRRRDEAPTRPARPRSLVGSAGLIACLTAFCLTADAAAQPRDTWKDQPAPDRLLGVRCLVVSPDGKTVAECIGDDKVRLWDLATGKKTTALVADQTAVGGAAFTPDGKSLVALGRRAAKNGELDTDAEPYSVKVWDLATLKVRLTIDYPDGLVAALMTPDGKSLFTRERKKGLLLYDLGTGKSSEPFDFGDAYRDVRIWALSPDGKTLAVGTQSANGILLYDLEKKAARATIPVGSQFACAQALTFSPDGKTLATGNGSDEVALWDAANGKPTSNLKFGPRVTDIMAIAFSPDGKTVAVGGTRWGVGLWDLAAGGERDDFEGDLHTIDVRCAVFTPDGKTLITGGWDKDRAIWLWDVPQGKPAGVKPLGELTPGEADYVKKTLKDTYAKPKVPPNGP